MSTPMRHLKHICTDSILTFTEVYIYIRIILFLSRTKMIKLTRWLPSFYYIWT